MKLHKLFKVFCSSFSLLVLGRILYANPIVTPSADFGGGLNLKTACTDIAENESCDMNNMLNDLYGASFKRNGSKRYIDLALSTNPINSIKRVWISSNNVTYKALIATTADRIYYSTNDTNPGWVLVSSGLTGWNQHWNFKIFGNRVLMTGDGLTDHIKSFNILNGSAAYLLANDLSSAPIVFQAKHLLASKNYLLAANIRDVTLPPGTTWYPSRLYYSLLLQPSSFTAERYLTFQENDGEEITGLGELGDVFVFKESSIHQLNFSALNRFIDGGDQQQARVVDGFGCVAPRTLVNTGDYFIFLSRDGVRLWDGLRRNRITLAEESRVLSTKIEPIIRDIFKNGTFRNCSGYYYAKRSQYFFAYEDSSRLPRGRANSIMVLDLLTGNWFSFRNWNPESFTSLDEPGGTEDLVYGDSNDGYVHLADQEGVNDSRLELPIATMDSTITINNQIIWQRGTTDYTNVQEGTGAVRMVLSSSIRRSSITYTNILNLGTFPDGTKVTKDDKLSFRAFVASNTNLQSLRVDLELNNINPGSDFDTNFTSVTFSSVAFITTSGSWTRIEIPLSSFTLISDWTSLTSTLPWANALTFFGIRFVSTGIADCSVTIDDLRLVGGQEQSIGAYRFTKQYSMGSQISKTFLELLLNSESAGDARYYVDVFSDFGDFAKRETITGGFGKELFVGGYNGNNGVFKLNSNDFTLLASTMVAGTSVFTIRPLVVDETYIFAGDQFNNRILKIAKSSMSVIVSSIGSIGSGSGNFNIPYQMAVDAQNLYVADFQNHRVKVHRKSDLAFVNSFGTLGLQGNTTSFHCPTGVAVDEKYAYIANDANYRISKLSKSTGGFVSSVDLNLNTIGDTTLHVDEKYLFVAYNLLASTSIDHQDIILEKRLKSDFSLLNRIKVRPAGISTIEVSTYSLLGDLSGNGDYIYCSFEDQITNGYYYIQKRLKRDLSLLKQYRSTGRHFAISHNGLDSKPRRKTENVSLGFDGVYIQLKFSESDLDNTFKLYNIAFKLQPHEIK